MRMIGMLMDHLKTYMTVKTMQTRIRTQSAIGPKIVFYGQKKKCENDQVTRITFY